MNIIGALMLFCVFTLVYILIIEVFTTLFRLTGMTRDKAHFQVISMLTNSGFTTKDSEPITKSVVRRKLAKVTIMFGYLFTVVIMSSVINIFLSLSNSEIRHLWGSAAVISLFLITLIIIGRVKVIQGFFDAKIEAIGRKLMFGKETNKIVLLDLFEDNAIAEVNINILPDKLNGKMLKDSGLKEEDKLQLILIKRDGETKSAITGDETLKENDIVVIFGKIKNINSVFRVKKEQKKGGNPL